MNRHPLHALPLTALLLGGLLSAGAPVWAAQPAAKAESSAKAAAKGSEEKTAEEHPGAEPGKTQTLALAIYDAFQAGNDAQATWLVLVTSLACVGLLMAAELLLKLKRRRR